MSKQVHVSHASCDHDKTPAARAKCRRIRRGNAPETTKAEIVARVKGKKVKISDAGFTGAKMAITDGDQQREVKQSNKRAKKVDVPALRELVQLVEGPAVYEVPDCEQDNVKQVNVNVIAKGSKVVHSVTGSDDAMLFACTKRLVNVDTAKITTNDVTCKNCLKLNK